MFTLRDQVFPQEAGTAAAVPVSVYEQRVGRVCDQLNDNERSRARQQKATRRQLQRAKTTISQRNALLDGVRRAAARSAHALASFTALEAPKAHAATRNDTAAAWNRNLARLRGYALRLDRAWTRASLLAALDHLSKLRPLLARDGDEINSGLQRVGAANCDLRPPIITPAFNLPPLRTEGSSASEVGTPETNSGDPGAASTQPDNPGATASVTTPEGGDEGSGVSVTTPGAGGGDDQGSGVSVTTPGAGGGGDQGSGVSVTTPGAEDPAPSNPVEPGTTTPATGEGDSGRATTPGGDGTDGDAGEEE
jgi:hypothetical protein